MSVLEPPAEEQPKPEKPHHEGGHSIEWSSTDCAKMLLGSFIKMTQQRSIEDMQSVLRAFDELATDFINERDEDKRMIRGEGEEWAEKIDVRNQGREREMERIERHLYRRQYQTAGGDWTTKFYAIFTCWDGKRRTFPAGDTLSDARDELGALRKLNNGRHDWDAEKRKIEQAKVKALTLGEYLDKTYLPEMQRTPLYPTKRPNART